MELKDCCKVDIRVNSPLSSSSFGSRFGTVRLGLYTWRIDSYIFLLFSYSIRFVLVRSCEMRVVLSICSYFYWERTVPNWRKKMIWPFDEEECVQISNFFHSSTFSSRFDTVKLGHYTKVSLYRMYCRTSTNWPFKFVRGIIPCHSSPFW